MAVAKVKQHFGFLELATTLSRLKLVYDLFVKMSCFPSSSNTCYCIFNMWSLVEQVSFFENCIFITVRCSVT